MPLIDGVIKEIISGDISVLALLKMVLHCVFLLIAAKEDLSPNAEISVECTVFGQVCVLLNVLFFFLKAVFISWVDMKP